MIALVLVSHSRALALALKDTLEKLYTGKVPPVAVAAGTGEDGGELGTDATAIMAAVEEVGATADGVLVLLDLGSAVLSAEMALDLLDEPMRRKVALCAAPLVEGAIAAAAQSSIGATLAEVRAEAENALRQKIEHLGSVSLPGSESSMSSSDDDNKGGAGPSATIDLRVENPHGLHARPAMKIIQTVAPFSSTVQIKNLRTDASPVSARSLVAINCLDARTGDTIRVIARGSDAAEAIRAMEALHATQFGDDPATVVTTNEPPRTTEVAAVDDRFRRGRPLSEGVASGILFFASREAPRLPPASINVNPSTELARLHGALAVVRSQLEASATALGTRLGRGNAAILEAQRMLANDPSLVERATAFIRDDRLPAAHAWQQASQLAADAYRKLEQPVLCERASDVQDLGLRVLRALGVAASLQLDLPDAPCILAVPTLLPSEVTELDGRRVRGIIAESLGATSHAAILLRAAGIAAVDGVNLQRLQQDARAGASEAALDGGTGEVWLAPDAATRHEIEERRARAAAVPVSPVVGERAFPPLCTRDGRRVELAVNVTSPAEVAAAVRAGAEAIGLLRTEFLFFDRTEAPTEDEQADALRQTTAALPSDTPVTVRTFDIGGDKPVAYLPVPPEQNPFLGMRGLRLALVHRGLFIIHLRAILRAAHGRRFRVMFPMVTEVEEIRRARSLLDEAHRQLTDAGAAHGWPVEIGMMVEVPAAALNVHRFVPEVDFFSLGTNDLTQYTLAAERGHPQLADFSDALHPAILRLVARVAAVASRNDKWVGVCGEAAADPVAAEVFIGLGVNELSVGVGALGRVRRLTGEFDYKQNRARAKRCLKAASSQEVRHLWVG